MLEVILREKDFALITIWINYRTKYSLITLLGFFFFLITYLYSVY